MEAPYILHALPSQTVFDFLSQRHSKLCHSISDIMDYFLASKDQQQTNQPNDLAGSLPYLVTLLAKQTPKVWPCLCMHAWIAEPRDPEPVVT